jgi:hypothetical protein
MTTQTSTNTACPVAKTLCEISARLAHTTRTEASVEGIYLSNVALRSLDDLLAPSRANRTILWLPLVCAKTLYTAPQHYHTISSQGSQAPMYTTSVIISAPIFPPFCNFLSHMTCHQKARREPASNTGSPARSLSGAVIFAYLVCMFEIPLRWSIEFAFFVFGVYVRREDVGWDGVFRYVSV